MTLVVVGDLGRLDTEVCVQQSMGAVASPGTPLPVRPGLGSPTLQERQVRVELSTQETNSCSVVGVAMRPAEVESLASMRSDACLEAASEMARAHLHEEAGRVMSAIDVSFVGHWYGWGAWIDAIRVAFACRPDRYADALSACAFVIRGLVLSGFNPARLDTWRADALARLDAAVAAEGTSSSAHVASHVARLLADQKVPTGAKWRRGFLFSVWQALDVGQCQRAFAAVWSGPPQIAVIGPAQPPHDDAASWDYPSPPRAPVVGELPEGSGTPSTMIAGPPRPTTSAWPYGQHLADKAISAPIRVHDQALDLDDVRFANGVRLLLKQTQFAKDQVLVSVNVGSGMGAEDLAVSWFFEDAFEDLGLGQVSAQSIRSLTAYRQASAKWTHSPGSFSLSGVTNRSDLGFQLELLWAHCDDPGWNAGAIASHRAIWVGWDAARRRSPAAASERFILDLAHWVVPGENDVQRVTVEQMQAAFGTMLKSAPKTIVVVGDFDVDATVALAECTFGRMPRQESAVDIGEARSVNHLDTGRHEIVELDAVGDVSQLMVVIALPETPHLNGELALKTLAYVLSDRLHARIRDQLGESYSPDASLATLGRTGPSFIQCRVAVAVGREQRVLDECRRVIDSFAKDGITDAELERVTGPALEGLAVQRQTNQRWIEELSFAHKWSDSLAESATLLTRLRGLTASEVSRAAATYLRPEAISTLIVTPKPKD
jgi:zinc protease